MTEYIEYYNDLGCTEDIIQTLRNIGFRIDNVNGVMNILTKDKPHKAGAKLHNGTKPPNPTSGPTNPINPHKHSLNPIPRPKT